MDYAIARCIVDLHSNQHQLINSKYLQCPYQHSDSWQQDFLDLLAHTSHLRCDMGDVWHTLGDLTHACAVCDEFDKME